MIEFTAYLLTGAVAGVMAGLLGIGGGLVIVPVLILLFRTQGIDESVVMHLAVGSSLATIIFTSISSVRSHHRRGSVIWPVFNQLAPGIVIGALLGALIAEQLATFWLQRVFAIFVMTVGMQMLLNAKVDGQRHLPGKAGNSAAGSVIGSLSAIVGIGGGSLTVPYLSWHRIPMVKAVATSSACGLPIALAGTAGFFFTGWGNAALPQWSSGYLYWPAIGGIVLTSIATAPLGVKLAHSLPVAVLKRIFALLLIIIGVRLFTG